MCEGYMWTCVLVQAEAGGHFSGTVYFFRRVLPLACNSSSSLGYAKDPPVSVSTVLRSPEHATKPGFLTWVLGMKLRSSACKASA